MPKTLAGFLLFVGILFLFYSIIEGPIRVKNHKLPKLVGEKRIIIGFIGILFIIVSTCLYVFGKGSMLLRSRIKKVDSSLFLNKN